MEVYQKQIRQGVSRFLVLTDEDPKTRTSRAIIVNLTARTVQRVKSVPALLRSEAWQPVTPGDPTLDALVRLVPALRSFRGIEIRLLSGETAWVRWRQWSSDNPHMQRLLTETTHMLQVPAYEPDGDYFLAVQAVAALGGELLDAPRSVHQLGEEAY